MKTQLSIKYEQNAKGTWVASVQGVDGFVVSGRTIDRCRQRAIAWLESQMNDIDSMKIVEDVVLPECARTALAQFKKTQERADDAASRLKAHAIETAALLTAELGLGLCDVGELMGVSRQRIHQLLSE